MANDFLGEATPLAQRSHLPAEQTGQSRWDRLGVQSRSVWSGVIVVLLFVGKGVQPFGNDVTHMVQTALVDDPRLGADSAMLGGLFSAIDVTGGLSKLLVAATLRSLGPRNAWLIVLAGNAVNMALIAKLESLTALFVCGVGQALLYAWIFPATTMAIAGWVDGHLLGRAIGFVAVATKLTPSLIAELYRWRLSESWTQCYAIAACVFAGMLCIFFVLMRSSAEAVGFRPPTPPGARNSAGSSSSKDSWQPPLAREPSSLRAVYYALCMRRTWMLVVAFTFLVLCKNASRFTSLYAKLVLQLSPSEASTVYTANAVASLASGLLGGLIYDLLPGGKMGVGVFMTSLNLLNVAAFAWMTWTEAYGEVTLVGLKVFAGIVGFANVLPISLPFQIYAMALGGVEHCGMLVAGFELCAHVTEAAFDLCTGQLLNNGQYGLWLLLNLGFAIVGAAAMAYFYYLDYQRAPSAHSLTAAPSVNDFTRAHSKLQLWMESPSSSPRASPRATRRGEPTAVTAEAGTGPATQAGNILSADSSPMRLAAHAEE